MKLSWNRWLRIASKTTKTKYRAAIYWALGSGTRFFFLLLNKLRASSLECSCWQRAGCPAKCAITSDRHCIRRICTAISAVISISFCHCHDSYNCLCCWVTDPQLDAWCKKQDACDATNDKLLFVWVSLSLSLCAISFRFVHRIFQVRNDDSCCAPLWMLLIRLCVVINSVKMRSSRIYAN